MKNGTKGLRLASVLQIILGISSIVVTYFLIDKVGINDIKNIGDSAIYSLIITYGLSLFQVIAGIFGLLLSKKKSIITVIFGLLLFIPQLINFININGNIALIIVNIVFLFIPYYYLHSAYKNYKNTTEN